MFKFLKFRRQNDLPTARRQQFCSRPLVEGLEGRQLQSGLAPIQGAHIGSPFAAVQGAHIGSPVAAVQGAHIGGMAIPGGGGVGQHIG